MTHKHVSDLIDSVEEDIILLFSEFFRLALDDGFHYSVSDGKSPLVSRRIIIILADLNNDGHHSSSYFLVLQFLYQSFGCPIGWSCRVHWRLLCRGLRPPPQWTPSIWHLIIWWCASSDAEDLGNAEHPFIANAPWSALARNGSTW